MVLGSPHDEVDVFLQARRCPAAGIVHCVINEVLLVCSELARRILPPLGELIKELATLMFVSQGRLSVEDSVPVVPDGTEEHLPQACLEVSKALIGVISRHLYHRGEPIFLSICRVIENQPRGESAI